MKGCFAFIFLLLLSQVCAAQGSPNYVGFFDVGNCNQVAGWAADKNRPNAPINVTVFSDLTPVATVLANVPRPDVSGLTGDNGLHGFSIPLPPSLNDTHSHTVHVRFETTNVELSNSPKTIGPCVTPPEGSAQQVTGLKLTLKIDNGAETTKSRTVALYFDAKEVRADGNHTAVVTDYRVLEVGLNQPLSSIEAAPWQHYANSLLNLELGLRNDSGQRYGERRVLFQVKEGTLASDVASDTIELDPVLKDYTVHAASDHTHPLVKYAASQGYTFPRTFFEVCSGGHGGSSPSDISSGFADIAGGTLNPPPTSSNSQVSTCNLSPNCETRFEYELFGGRQLNKFWHIKSVNVSGADPKFNGVNHYRLKGHVVAQTSADCPSGTICAPDGTCVPSNDSDSNPTVTIGDIVIEGPEEDDFVSAANPWENAFVEHFIIHPPPPGTHPGLPPHD